MTSSASSINSNYSNIDSNSHKPRSLEEELLLLRRDANKHGTKKVKELREKIEKAVEKSVAIKELAAMIKARSSQNNQLDLANNLDMKDAIKKARDLGVNFSFSEEKTLFSHEELMQVQQSLLETLASFQKDIEQEKGDLQSSMRDHQQMLDLIMSIFEKLSAIISKIIANIGHATR